MNLPLAKREYVESLFTVPVFDDMSQSITMCVIIESLRII